MTSRYLLVQLWASFLLSSPRLSLGLKFDGVNLNIYGICWGQSHVEHGIQQWEANTGAKVYAKFTCSADDLEAEISSDMRTGANFYDLYICTNKMVPLWASQGWLKDLTDDMKEKPELGWAEVLPLFRDIVATYAGRVYTVPWDGDVFLTYFRRDLSDQDSWPDPKTWTWEDFVSISQRYDGQDLNGDGEADYGACLASGLDTNSFYHWIVPYLTMAQALGERQGVFLNLTDNGVTPIVDNAAFRKGIDILRASHGSYPVGKSYSDARTDFTNGRCAIYFTWPSGGTQSINTIDSNGTKVYIHGRMGVAGLPGSRQVLDWRTGDLVDCSPTKCPYAVDPVTKAYDGINRVAWYANGGMGAVVNAGSSARRQEAVLDFAMWYAKNLEVTMPSPYNPFRENHFNVSDYVRSGWNKQDAKQYVDAELEVLGMKNLVLDFRVPGIKQFFEAYSKHYLELLQGNQSVIEKAIARIKQNVWDFIEGYGDIVKNPELEGQLELERIYRQGIGLPMRSLTELCQPGTGYVETNAKARSGKCSMCSPGRWGPGGSNQVCLDCAPGTHESSTGSKACSRCEAGTYSSLGQMECTKCPPNTAPGRAGQAMCPCERGRYGNGSVCVACPEPLTTEQNGEKDDSACVCPEGWYKPINHNSGACLQCGEGLDCAINSLEANIPASANASKVAMVGSYPKVMPSFYSYYSEPLVTYMCLSDRACPGGWPEHCGPHMVDLACGACKTNYFMLDGDCHACTEFDKLRILFPILPAVVGPILVVILYRSGRKDVETWQAPKEGLLSVLVLCLAFTQTLAVIRSFNAIQDGHLRGSWTWMRFTLDIFSLAKTECTDFDTFSAAFIGKILVPVYMAAVFLATWVISMLTRWRMDPNILASCYGGVFNAVYISIAAQALSLFQCYDHPEGRGASLLAAANVVCYEGEWNSLVVVAVVAILVFCVFSIALYSFVIWISLDHVREKTFRMRWKFLLVKFRPGLLKWTLMLLIKGLWINLASVIFRTPTRQLIWLCVGMLLYFAGSLYFTPWRMYCVAMFDVVIHGLLVLIFGIYPFLVQDSFRDLDAVGLLVVTVSYFGYAATLVWAGCLLYQMLCVPKKDWTQAAEELSAIFEQSGGRPEWLAEIFERVPWIDAQNMIRMQHVLESEMRGGRHGSQRGSSFFRPTKLQVISGRMRNTSIHSLKRTGTQAVQSVLPKASCQDPLHQPSQESAVRGSQSTSNSEAPSAQRMPLDSDTLSQNPTLLTSVEDQETDERLSSLSKILAERPESPAKIEEHVMCECADQTSV